MITSITRLVLFAAAWLCLASELSARPAKATLTAPQGSPSGSGSPSEPTPFEPPSRRRQDVSKKRRQVKRREGHHSRTAPVSSEAMPVPTKRNLLAVHEALAAETQLPAPNAAEDPEPTPDDDDHLVARTNLPLSSAAPERDVRQGAALSSEPPEADAHVIYIQHQERGDEPITTGIPPILPPELEQRDLKMTTPASGALQPELEARDVLPTITTHLAQDPPKMRPDLPTVTSIEGGGEAFVENHHQQARTYSHLERNKRQEDGSASPASTVFGQLNKRDTGAKRHPDPVQNPYNNDGSLFDLTGNNYRGDAGSWKPNDHYSREEYEKKYGNVKQTLLEWWGVQYAPKKCLEDPQFDDGSEDDIGPLYVLRLTVLLVLLVVAEMQL